MSIMKAVVLDAPGPWTNSKFKKEKQL
jgi:hypothetical protein